MTTTTGVRTGWGQGSPNLTYAQLEQLWINAGGPAAVAPTMAAIGLAESGGNQNALNGADGANGANTQSSFGLWQISTGTHLPPAGNWNDPAVNATLAVGKYQRQGLKAWGTYTSGSYLAHLPGGSSAATSSPSGSSGAAAPASWWSNALGDALTLGGFGWLTKVGGAVDATGKAINGTTASIASIGAVVVKTAEWVSKPHNWVRIGEVGAGLVAVFIGLHLLAASGAGPIAEIAGVPGDVATKAGHAVKATAHAARDTAGAAAAVA